MLEKQNAGVFCRAVEPKLFDPCVQLQSKDLRLDRVTSPRWDTDVLRSTGSISMRCGDDKAKHEHAVAVQFKPWRTSDGQGVSLKWDPDQ